LLSREYYTIVLLLNITVSFFLYQSIFPEVDHVVLHNDELSRAEAPPQRGNPPSDAGLGFEFDASSNT
jgi:hypothetical protein